MSTGPKIQWDESRSPQWRYLLQKKDPKYNSRKREKDFLFKEAKKERNMSETAKKTAEYDGMLDCSSQKDLINAQLTSQLKKINKTNVKRIGDHDTKRITRLSSNSEK
jgi:hypothetical protein